MASKIKFIVDGLRVAPSPRAVSRVSYTLHMLDRAYQCVAERSRVQWQDKPTWICANDKTTDVFCAVRTLLGESEQDRIFQAVDAACEAYFAAASR